MAGTDNLLPHQPVMVGQGGSTDFTPGQNNQTPQVNVAQRVAAGWVCPICLEGGVGSVILELTCKHALHESCFKSMCDSSHAGNCPECRIPLVSIRGDQPAATMSWVVINSPCPGERTRETIRIDYQVPAGIIVMSGQQVSYPSECRTAWLPNHAKGRKALAMLKTAFECGLVFTVGYSQSRNQNNVVVWNDIPHKTVLKGRAENHGYPDPAYVDRLINILRQNYVPEPGDSEVP